MKKVISGSRYDTETAQQLASWDGGDPADRLKYFEETLYRTKAGKYFLHGRGGPMTAYATPCERDGWSGGEAILPLDETAARAMVEEHCDADQYEAIFGAIDEGKVQKTVYISPAADRRLEALKASTGMSIPRIIDRAILAYQPEV